MNTDKIISIVLLDFTDDVSEPLEMLLSPRNPDEVNLWKWQREKKTKQPNLKLKKGKQNMVTGMCWKK